MASIGQTLADARRKRKATHQDVEKAIKIRAKHIGALEKEAFAEIPGEAYVIGFIKTYAAWLGLDSGEIVAAYKDKIKARADQPEPSSRAGLGKLIKRIIVLAVPAVLVGLGIRILLIRGS